MTNVLIVGAASAIAEATARLFAEEGCRLFLVGRRAERLAVLCDDLKSRGAEQTASHELDMNDFEGHEAMLAAAENSIGPIDIAYIAHGTLPDQKACQDDVDLTLQEFRTNALSTIALLTRLANDFERRRTGTIAVITSVAGDRGRESNYVYGAAKAAVDSYLEGMRQRLHKSGVRVVTIKPGFVDTPMTAAFDKGLLWAKPDAVAQRIHRAITKGGDVIYVPAFWRLIMLVIRSIPRRIFKAIKL
ncbi:SDR family oxidoreductase [Paracoccus alkanivorans]|uniref:Short-chain dehydrogenase n=1 Tax=Paracoccus alkanivorans TaxID=2116655 RepID=A0A3M0M790_9RHOB|nr:SDR family oxidoreductase [Paracoccus alkanivorans]RMC33658.1 short-chain dehydrogenase [Paracoccus alkanivorans]